MRSRMCDWRIGGLTAAGLLLAVTAAGQDAATLKELKEWHDKVVRPDKVVPAELAEQARAKLKTWNLSVAALNPDQRGQLIRLEIHAALAAGDAAAALKALPDLELDFPTARETLEAAYLAATAAGDAQRAKTALDKLKEQPGADDRLLSTRTRRLQLVGQPAPDATIKTEDGERIALRGRDGVVLVVDLWRVVQKPGDADIKGLVALFEPYMADVKVQFVGINSDGPTKVDAARKFAADSGYTWPQYYEKRTAAPLTNKDFQAGTPPWTVVIDGEGNVRVVGAATDPALHYAVRAAVAETRGRYAALRPKTTAGRAAPAGPTKPVAATPAAKKDDAGKQPPAGSDEGAKKKETGQPGGKEGERVKPKGELPSNPEARALLTRARLYLKTGKKTEAKKILQDIIRDYPGTLEAREAEEILHYL